MDRGRHARQKQHAHRNKQIQMQTCRKDEKEENTEFVMQTPSPMMQYGVEW